MDPRDLARYQREVRNARKLRELDRASGDYNLGGLSLSSSLAGPGREGVQRRLPSTPAEIIMVVADTIGDGGFIEFTNVQSPPTRVGFTNLVLPTTDIVVSFQGIYNCVIDVEWVGEGQGGLTEVWVGESRIRALDGRRVNAAITLGVMQAGQGVRVRARPNGAPQAIRVRLTIQLGVLGGAQEVVDYDPDLESPLPTPPPDAPVAPTVEAGTELNNSWVIVTWTPVANAIAYEVRVVRLMDGATVVQRVEGGDSTSTKIEWLDPLTEYAVSIWAIDEYARLSEVSPETLITTPGDETVPEVPAGISISAGFTTVTVQWDENLEPDVRFGEGGYAVQLATNSTFTANLVSKETKATIISFAGLELDTTYWARVAAKDKSGNQSDWSAAVSVKTPLVETDFFIEPNSITETEIAPDSISTPLLKANAVVAGKIASNAVTTLKLAANAVTAEKIQAGQISTDHIVAAGLDADVIKFGSMHGNRITANTLNVNRLTSSTLTSRTITIGTGGNLQVQGTSSASLLIDSSGLRLFNTAGNPTVTLSASNGTASFAGAITGGTISIGSNFWVTSTGTMTASNANISGTINAATIVGGTISGANISTSTSGVRVVIGSDDRISYYDSLNRLRGAIYWANNTNTLTVSASTGIAASLSLSGDTITMTTVNNHIHMNSNTQITGTLTATNGANFGSDVTITGASSMFNMGLTGNIDGAGTQNGLQLDAGGVLRVARNAGACASFNRKTDSGAIVVFQRAGVVRGFIEVHNTGDQTRYLSASDYRLKDEVVDFDPDDAAERLRSLKVRSGVWRDGGGSWEGFLAHELAEVMPMVVSGTKDAVDDDGEPVYQAVDKSGLVPTLAAGWQAHEDAIQTLTAAVEALNQRLDQIGGIDL